MQENFNKALDFVLRWEGGRVNNPNDPGGLTIYGISAKYYPKEVAEMDKLWQQGKYSECKKIASAIYKKRYWDACSCDKLSYPLDLIVFDTAVNMGVLTALELLKKYPDWKDYLFFRVARYKDLVLKNKSLSAFLVGWINRVVNLREYIGA